MRSLQMAEIEPTVDSIRTARLELVPLSAAFVEALKRGDRPAAEREVAARVSRRLLNDPTHVVQLQLAQRAADGHGMDGIGRAIVLAPVEGPRRVIGSVGFHGPPDDRGRLEVGFSIDPAVSRRGLAAEAVRALIEWAMTRYGVRRFVVSVPAVDEPGRRTPVEIGVGATAWGDDALVARLPHAGQARSTRR